MAKEKVREHRSVGFGIEVFVKDMFALLFVSWESLDPPVFLLVFLYVVALSPQLIADSEWPEIVSSSLGSILVEFSLSSW